MAELPYGPTAVGSVVLDIGGHLGALALRTAPELVGEEIEVSPVEDDATRTHTAVRERRGGPEVQYVAVFAALNAGDYTVWGLNGTRGGTVTITGGEVATLDWRHH